MSGASGSLPNHIDEIEGWFYPTDHYLFDWVLGRHDAASGDLVELGAYLGKSAIYMGRHLREGETFTVCDLFDTPAPDTRTDKEMRVYYSTLTRAKFEQNYLRFHDVLPVIVEGPTAMLPSRVTPQSCRFAHVAPPISMSMSARTSTSFAIYWHRTASLLSTTIAARTLRASRRPLGRLC